MEFTAQGKGTFVLPCSCQRVPLAGFRQQQGLFFIIVTRLNPSAMDLLKTFVVLYIVDLVPDFSSRLSLDFVGIPQQGDFFGDCVFNSL